MQENYKLIIDRFQKNIPVDIFALAKELGLRVFTTDKWADTISGKIKKGGENAGTSGYSIYLNGNHPEARQRFTAAHEIAHFILHKNFIGNGITDDSLYRSTLSNKIEAQANKYAAGILMPYNKIVEHWGTVENLSNSDKIKTMAKIFKVSQSAMAIRLGLPF